VSPPHEISLSIVIIDEDFRSENTSGLGIRALAAAIEKGDEILA
jgi:ornithine decarboxylase/lysine decarboxylase/arginine decarboxylase